MDAKKAQTIEKTPAEHVRELQTLIDTLPEEHRPGAYLMAIDYYERRIDTSTFTDAQRAEMRQAFAETRAVFLKSDPDLDPKRGSQKQRYNRSSKKQPK